MIIDYLFREEYSKVYDIVLVGEFDFSIVNFIVGLVNGKQFDNDMSLSVLNELVIKNHDKYGELNKFY